MAEAAEAVPAAGWPEQAAKAVTAVTPRPAVPARRSEGIGAALDDKVWVDLPAKTAKTERSSDPVVTHHPYKRSGVQNSRRWLTVGAVSFGLGAALAAGTSVAQADTGEADTSAANSAVTNSSRGSAKNSAAPRPRASSAQPIPAAGAAAPDVPSTATSDETSPSPRDRTVSRTGPRAGALLDRDQTPHSRAVALPAADTIGDTGTDTSAETRVDAVAEADVPVAFSNVAELSPANSDPSWNMESYLGGVEIVPGSSVLLAREQIAEAQQILAAGTWGTGNLPAGVASLVPQLFLTQAAWALSTWQDSIEQAKSSFADTVGVPILHELAGLSLLATTMIPSLATVALEAASLTVPIVGVLGARDAATAALGLVEQSQLNGLVYAAVPFLMGQGVNQTATVSVNGGPWAPVVYDTGSSGLSITMPYVGQSGLGPSTGSGDGAYGEGPSIVRYQYNTYTTQVGLRDRISTGPTTVNIVTDATSQAYNNYQFPSGIVGVLGMAANRGTGPNNVVALPGELKDGVLLLQFGWWGLAVFGPNPLPARVSVPGAPDAYAQIQINDGPKQAVNAIIDSGGVYGYVPASLVPGQTESYLPTGTRVSVYTGDGQTLLYSYTTTEAQPLGISEGDEFNTGNIPFQLGPIYIDYSQPDGIGATVFNYV